MRTSAKGLLAILLATLAFPASALSAAAPGPDRINLPNAEFGFTFEDEDDEPEITDRVARVSIVDGDVKVRRGLSDEWEKVTNNLPLVEGDEIATSENGRLEIQFAKNQHVRLDRNSYLKIATLNDEGVALSLSLGSMSVRLIDFDTNRAYFELDAPKATISLQRSGRYRVDAGKTGDSEINVSVTEDGEARIYTENSGFSLKNNRSALIFIDGDRAGEWEPQGPDNLRDDFAFWIAERERFVAQQLKDSYFGRYYDDDIYGAEELDDHGDWINTPEYGHVWAPSRLALAQYSDWSPYRYGHWRHMQPYGWVWVNDEPWGWATYHYGRWIWHHGRWVWAPYGYYRPRRSWWWPAYVSINVYNNNVCWYPLGYYRRRHRFNRDFEASNRKGPARARRTLPPPIYNQPTGPGKGPRGKDEIPPNGVVGIDKKDFGVARSVRRLPVTVATEILTKSDDGGGLTGVTVPDRRTRQSSPLTAETPKIGTRAVQVRTGAAPRSQEKAMDEELRRTRMRPTRNLSEPVGSPNEPVRPSEPRKTGITERATTPRQVPVVPGNPEPVPEKPRRVEWPVRDTRDDNLPAERQKETRQVRETPRNDSPPPPRQVRETPRNDSPPPPPRQPEKSRDDAPVKSTPRNDPPPSKSDSKSDDKPAPSRGREKPNSR